MLMTVEEMLNGSVGRSVQDSVGDSVADSVRAQILEYNYYC